MERSNRRIVFVLQSAPSTGVESIGKYLSEGDIFCHLIHFYSSRILRSGVQRKRYWEGEKQVPYHR